MSETQTGSLLCLKSVTSGHIRIISVEHPLFVYAVCLFEAALVLLMQMVSLFMDKFALY